MQGSSCLRTSHARRRRGWPSWPQLERARIEVFDGPDARPLGQDEVAALGLALPDLFEAIGAAVCRLRDEAVLQLLKIDDQRRRDGRD